MGALSEWGGGGLISEGVGKPSRFTFSQLLYAFVPKASRFTSYTKLRVFSRGKGPQHLQIMEGSMQWDRVKIKITNGASARTLNVQAMEL